MEHHVVIEKLCSCAKKEGLSQIATYDAKDTAHEAAQIQLERMNGSFCGKHEFQLYLSRFMRRKYSWNKYSWNSCLPQKCASYEAECNKKDE